MKIKSIGIVGGFPLASANLGYEMASYFSKAGQNTKLIIKESHLEEWKKLHPEGDPYKDKILQVIHKKSRFLRNMQELKAARQFDLIFSIGLGGLWYLTFLKKPYVLYATGADLTELAGGKGFSGLQVKQAQRAFKKAKLVFYSAEFGHQEMINYLGLNKTIPWRQFVDTNFWKGPINSKETEKLMILHPTSLDWIPKTLGQRLKSNDVLFKGFRIFLDEDGNGKLFYRKRGQNVKETEKLIGDLDLSEHVESLPDSPNQEDQKNVMMKMDVVADQFGVGNFGLITLEAMSLGKPVIVYLPKEAARLAYPLPDELPPILNASNANEISQQLHLMSDTKKLYQKSVASRNWIEKYHEPEILARWYLNNISKNV